MVCKCALPSMRADAASKHVPTTNDEDGNEEGTARPPPLPLPRPLPHPSAPSSSRRASLAASSASHRLWRPSRKRFPLFVNQTSGRPLMNLVALALPRAAQEAFDERSAVDGFKVRTQFRPRVRTSLRTFFPQGRSPKKPLSHCAISSTNMR